MPAGYFFVEKPPMGILVAQAVGITTSAFCFGQNASVSYLTVPALLLAPAPLAAKQWQKVYSIGVQVAPALAVVGTLATGYLAYHQETSSAPFKLNLLATFILPTIIPYTLTVMQPINDKLDVKAESFAATAITDKAAEAGVAQGETVHALIDEWASMNLIRACITGVGCLFTVMAALNKLEVAKYTDAALRTGANRIK